MKKNCWIAGILAGVLAFSLTACGSTEKKENGTDKAGDVIVKIGLTGTVYEDIWESVGETLESEGIKLELVQFSDFSLPNEALNSGEIDMNAFQHHAYFDNEVAVKGYDISAIGDTFVIAMNLYSNKISDVSELKDGDKIAIPGDASNGGRALRLLESAGVIQLKADAGENPEISDIETYNVQVSFVEADASNIYSMLPDVTAAVINGNYALDCGLEPQEEGIFFEKDYEDNRYFCLIAVRSDDVDNEVYQKVVDAFQSEKTKQIFEDQFKGFFVPVWE